MDILRKRAREEELQRCATARRGEERAALGTAPHTPGWGRHPPSSHAHAHAHSLNRAATLLLRTCHAEESRPTTAMAPGTFKSMENTFSSKISNKIELTDN
eukprot:gene1840-1120_t